MPPPLPPLENGAGGTLHQIGLMVFETLPNADEPHRGSYELVAWDSSALASITVDEVFENLEKDENSSSESESEAEDSTDSSDDDE